MKAKNLASILKSPCVTEKVVKLNNTVAFWVDLKADKSTIKRAVEAMFEVKVDKVNTVVKPIRPRRGAKPSIKRRQFKKKAYIQLAEGHSLNLDFEQ